MSKKEYKKIKNYLHNDLGISKEFIREIIITYINNNIEYFIKSYFELNNIENLVKNIIKKEMEVCLGKDSSFDPYNIDYFKKYVVNIIKEDLQKQFLNKFKVSLVNIEQLKGGN
jgi:hypothetical protein